MKFFYCHEKWTNCPTIASLFPFPFLNSFRKMRQKDNLSYVLLICLLDAVSTHHSISYENEAATTESSSYYKASEEDDSASACLCQVSWTLIVLVFWSLLECEGTDTKIKTFKSNLRPSAPFWMEQDNKNYYVVRKAGCTRSRYTLKLSLIFCINECMN